MAATSVEEAVYNRLTADTPFITAITALYWRQAPAGTSLPYVVYFQIDDPRTKELLSYYGGEARLQFSVFAETASDAVAMSQTIVEKTRTIRGLQNGLRLTGTVANVLTQPANVDGIYHRTVDVIVRYTEEA